MRLLVINNLLSGLGVGSIYDYLRGLLLDGDDVVIRSSDGTTDLRLFLHDAADFDFVVVSGGDGSIANVAYMLADTGIPILPFPAGTANLLVQNLAEPTEPHALVKMTRDFKTMDFDLGEVEFSDGTKRGFTIMAGAGYDALIMKDAEPGKKIFGPMAYLTSAVANAAPQFSRFSLTIDGHKIESSGVGILVINFAKIQFDLPVVHENLPKDGVFDVVIMNTKDAFGLIPVLFAAMLDRSGEFPARTDAFDIHRGSEVTVIADPPLPVQYDGEYGNMTTPFTARILPEAGRFIVSEECLKLYG